MNELLQLLAVLGLGIGGLFLRLHVLTKMWGYIAVPMGAPHVGLLPMYGLFMIVALMTAKYEPTEDQEVIGNIVQSLVSWGFAYWIFNIVQSLVSWGFAYWIFG